MLAGIGEAVGPERIANDCEFIAAVHGRRCEPVRVLFRAAGSAVVASSERSGDRLQALWYSPSRTCRDTGLSEMGSRRARLTANS